ITSTPVIDLATGTLYVAAKTRESGQYFQRLHALDIATGAEKFGGPVAIAPTIAGEGDDATPGDGVVRFDARMQLNRPGILLSRGVLYRACGAPCDSPPSRGWIVASDAATLGLRGFYNTPRHGRKGGIWQSGQAPSADDSGDVFISSGDGTFS